MNKHLTIFLVLIVLGGIFAVVPLFHNNKIDCNEIGGVYLKPSEMNSVSGLAKKGMIVIIPEENQVVAETEILDCPSFNYKNYIRGFE